MSFRGRLRVFFTIIVIVPMIALAVVLLRLASQSETGKADAGIATAVTTAFSVYEQARADARDELGRIARDPELGAAIASGERAAVRARLRSLAAAEPELTELAIGDRQGRVLAAVGEGVAPATGRFARANSSGAGTLSVSVTTPEEYTRAVKRLTAKEVAVLDGAEVAASTLSELSEPPPPGANEFTVDDRDYRGRRDSIPQEVGPPTGLVVFQDAEELQDSIADSRLLILTILLAFVVLALASSVFVIRALQRQIGEFLGAARRLAKGDFQHPVPTHGQDEFAALGDEFNTMSEQLAEHIDELERKRGELEDTIRRIGEAFASGLDRQGVVELMVQTAVDACEADAGRALPLDAQALKAVQTGSEDAVVIAALEAAERRAFAVRPDETKEVLEGEQPLPPEQRHPFEASVDGVHALAIPMTAHLGARSYAQYVGVVSIARRGDAFSASEKDLLEYLTGQAVVSIENADLHETVQRQAITDELTGLSNVRSLHAALDREIERARRFDSPLSLVMLDIDNFKKVNDTYGHQQGDEVLTGVARVMRDLSRDIDVPARYGGEELAVVLPQTDSEGAAQLAERMREAVEAMRVPMLEGEGDLRVTASFGVAEIPRAGSDKGTLIAAADAALYRAKRGGKNRVERADRVPASSS